MTLVQKVKANSSKWIKTKDDTLKVFSWQRGYAAFSVWPNEVDIVKGYIERQHNHHSSNSFKQEYREYHRKFELEYDERYLWD